MTIGAAHVGGGLKTVNGDVNIGPDARIEGGILVEKPNQNWFNRSRRPPRIVIGPGAVVEGRLRFEHEVELLVSDRAKIGPVEGAKAVTFSGDEPRRVPEKCGGNSALQQPRLLRARFPLIFLPAPARRAPPPPRRATRDCRR